MKSKRVILKKNDWNPEVLEVVVPEDAPVVYDDHANPCHVIKMGGFHYRYYRESDYYTHAAQVDWHKSRKDALEARRRIRLSRIRHARENLKKAEEELNSLLRERRKVS